MKNERAVLRIALFSDSALPVINGVSVSLDRLSSGLTRLGHTVTLFAPAHPEALKDEDGVVRLPSCQTLFAPSYPLAVPFDQSARESFLSRRFDLVHFHTPFSAGRLGIKWATAAGIPLIGSFHTDYRRCLAQYGLPLRWGSPLAAWFVKSAFGASSLNLVPSETAGSWLDQHGVLAPLRVVPNGAPLPQPLDRKTLRRALGWKEGQLVVLSVGRLAPEKNPEALIHAFALTAPLCPGAILAMVGDGPLRGKLGKLCRSLGLDGRVIFMGGRTPSEASAAYAAADLFVLPSFNETQGLALAEAMSWGLPVVAVRGGAACDAFVDGVEGIAADPDPAAIASALTSLYQKASLRASLGRAAQARARSWTCQAHAKAVEAAYFEVLGRRGLSASCGVEQPADQLRPAEGAKRR